MPARTAGIAAALTGTKTVKGIDQLVLRPDHRDQCKVALLPSLGCSAVPLQCTGLSARRVERTLAGARATDAK